MLRRTPADRFGGCELFRAVSSHKYSGLIPVFYVELLGRASRRQVPRAGSVVQALREDDGGEFLMVDPHDPLFLTVVIGLRLGRFLRSLCNATLTVG